ncbi:hypothetical protein [Streptomyces mirabilis]|uniref:hypothetical protein n=1 Tax=Streptomyces mirabilis TaxID=68239 RepID=UPI003696353E
MTLLIAGHDTTASAGDDAVQVGVIGGDLRYVIWQFGIFRSPSERGGEALTLTRGAQDLGSHPPGECTPLIVLERPVVKSSSHAW